ncbi:hypothetical protein HPP92_010705 [Vanilla planifolia]|uniref:CBS domain-containing protein n=1 Tax=Vanilla planifolia TaxID=51239 RepID=A0A835R5Q7_VANPL|nr:hypothetical protein HPP92_010705 [Vanilla planifolia]
MECGGGIGTILVLWHQPCSTWGYKKYFDQVREISGINVGYVKSDIKKLLDLSDGGRPKALQFLLDAKFSAWILFDEQETNALTFRYIALQEVMERLSSPGVRRVVIVEAGSKCVEGIISLSDIFRVVEKCKYNSMQKNLKNEEGISGEVIEPPH